jgi:PAS domain S-box-containing protein
VSPHNDPRRHRAVAVTAAAWSALVLLVVGAAWHVDDVRKHAAAEAERTLRLGAARAARSVDVWVAEQDGDAKTLADVASIHATDSTAISPVAASHILRLQMEALQRRGGYRGIWIVDTHGKVLGGVNKQALSAPEDSAVARAIRTHAISVGRPERHDSTVTVGVAKPVIVTDHGVPRAEAAVVFRADLNRTVAPTPGPPASPTSSARPVPTATPVIVMPIDGVLNAVSLCVTPSPRICILPASDTLARLAIASQHSYQAVIDPDGRQLLVATQRAASLPWAVYFAVDEATQFAPMRERLRFEALVLISILVVAGLATYAYDRSAHLRRLTEQAQNEERFAAIVNTAMDAIIIVDQRYDIEMVNSAAEAMFGYPSRDAIGRSVVMLMPEESREELRRALSHALISGEDPRVFSAERHAAGCRRDGSIFPIDLSVSHTRIDGHSHLTIVIRDITEWRRAEENSEWQRRVLESIATGVELEQVLTTVARFHETQSPGVDCAIHLLDDDGLTLRLVSAPSMHEEFVASMDEIVVGPHAGAFGVAVRRCEQVVSVDIDTDEIWSDFRNLAREQGYRASWAEPIVAPQGRILGAVALYLREPREPSPAELRITATATQLAGIAIGRAHTAETVRQSEASFRSFVENSPIGIYRATDTGRLLAVNASLVELLGYDSPAEVLALDMSRDIFTTAADREQLFRQLEGHAEARSREMEWRRKDGTVVTVRVSARAYSDDRASVWYSEGFVENVSPLRAAEQALRQSEKLAALGQLVSGVAHELNNPLAAILHFAEDLLDDERSPADLEALSVIRDQARRSRAIVRDLLSFVRFRDASRERVQLADALAASVKALQPTVEEAGARLTADLPTGNAFGNTDRAGLQQIVTNLVVNAAQACGLGGIVHLRARLSASELVVVVEDSGPGVPSHLIDRIFEPFFTTKPVGQGTGLGLSVTLGIVQQLGGRIAVENRVDNGETGARFIVTLPIDGVTTRDLARRVPSGDGRPIVATESGTPVAAPRVLIIDDEPAIRAALRRFFARRGWQVDEAGDGVEGLSILLSHEANFTVVISDLMMPGCSGVELHDHVAAVAPELLDRIIFSTGDTASKEAAAFVQRTRCTVLQKPFELRTLESVVMGLRQALAVS